MSQLQLNLDSETQLVKVNDTSPTVSIIWDRAVQAAAIETAIGPTIASRAYAMMHTAMYNAWSAYEDRPISTNLGDALQRPQDENTQANKTEAMSYSAYYVLKELFPEQKSNFDRLMFDLGYDPKTAAIDFTSPAGIGVFSAQTLLKYSQRDGANQLGSEPNSDGTPYSDYTNYQPDNQPGNIKNIELWTPNLVHSKELGVVSQQFLTPHWGKVTPFALESAAQFRPEPPQPFLLVNGTVNLDAKNIILEDGSSWKISRDLVGKIINPKFIAQAEEVVEYSANLTDKQKIIAEFWEDGSGTSFPPGTWMTFGQYVSARDDHTLDEDVKMFFALANSVCDAGIATWESKTYYDYVRPIDAIRTLGELGLIGEYNRELGGYAIDAYRAKADKPTILATNFITYQTPNSDFSPPFAEYTSGHSAFSAAAAEVLKQYTGSDYFGAQVAIEAGESRFEPGITPADNIFLEWDSFSEAADEAGISRLYGGIHFEEGDLNGRELGRKVGDAVFDRAQFYIDGGHLNRERDSLFRTPPDFYTDRQQQRSLNLERGIDRILNQIEHSRIDALKNHHLLQKSIYNDDFYVESGKQLNDFIVFGSSVRENLQREFYEAESLNASLEIAETLAEKYIARTITI